MMLMAQFRVGFSTPAFSHSEGCCVGFTGPWQWSPATFNQTHWVISGGEGVDFCLLGIYIIAAMDVVCTETAENKCLVYSGTKAVLQPSTGRGNLQGQETCSFEQAHVDFPSCWDLNATIVESKTERELSNAYQTDAIQMPNNLYQMTSAKYQMLNNCETADLSNEKSLKHENTKE